MSFRITGLDPAPFRPLYGLSEAQLAQRGATRMVVTDHPGFPDRITLEDVPTGATVLLLNHTSMKRATPYRATHAIFVREGALRPYDSTDELPPVMQRRLLSLRGFDANGMMQAAELASGAEIAPAIARLFEGPEITEIHAHNAARGCFSARITRA
ncbi:DUF1203 domain-containing protein [Oceanicola sp. 502str15]|uniref:DUF1203 domain-containing protein n=1 Tax=Oceanicola sp. 502str15 TaxID=2696061 RepID=UPI0020957DEC|nr:DUF1203 domain-containing protein [Oceanicola sp. 502str15]MCO6381601.1 DUF1203 domain-containing protein [Oceanicola sp. 502str15]